MTDNIIPANIMAALMNPELTSVPPPMTPQDLMNRHHQSAGQLPSGMPMLQPPPMNNIIAGSDIPPPVIPGFPIQAR